MKKITILLFIFVININITACLNDKETGLLNSPPEITSLNIEGVSGSITISFKLEDEEDDLCNISVEYSGGSKGKIFTNATTEGIPTILKPGTYTILWHSEIDQKGVRGDDYRIKITPSDSVSIGKPVISDYFSLDNNEPPVIENLSLSGVRGDIEINFSLYDAEGDNCQIIVEYKGGSQGENFKEATFKTYKDDEEEAVEEFIPGKFYTIYWESEKDEPLQRGDDFEIRLTPYDSKPGESITSKKFSLFKGISIDGKVGDIIVDDNLKKIYISNSSLGKVESILFNGEFLKENSYKVGSLPQGISLDKNLSNLYVCNSGGTTISVINLSKINENIREIEIPKVEGYEDRPYSIAVLNNSKALFSTTFSGSGLNGTIRELNLLTEEIKVRSEVDKVSNSTVIKGSEDGKFALIAPLKNPTTALFLYALEKDEFTKTDGAQSGIGTILDVAINNDGSLIYVINRSVENGRLEITGFNSSLRQLLKIPLEAYAIALASDGVVYAVTYSDDGMLEIAKIKDGVVEEKRIKVGFGKSIEEGKLRVSKDGLNLFAVISDSLDKSELIIIPTNILKK